jgi:CheY-like chemotaxis protein
MPSALLLCDDLLFASRIVGEARARGATMKLARSCEQLLDFVRQEAPCCVLLDLSFPGLDLPDLFRCLAENCLSPPRVAAYGAHVDTERLRTARSVGCDPVLPRSRVLEELPRLLG